MRKWSVLFLIISISLLFLTHKSFAQASSKAGINRNAAILGESTAISGLMCETAETGSPISVVWVWWNFIETTAPYPASSCQAGETLGPNYPGCHRYSPDLLGTLDSVLQAAANRGQTVILKLLHPPCWATGCDLSCDTDTSESNSRCGMIYGNHQDYFKLQWQDFVYNIASRYWNTPLRVNTFILWNEPNIATNFSPEILTSGDSVENQYMRLILWPAKAGLQQIDPSLSSIYWIAPELARGSNGVFKDSNWGTTREMNWISNWTDSFMRYFASDFPTYSVHVYDASQWIRGSMGDVYNRMNALGQGAKPLWLTEFNIRISDSSVCDATIQSNNVTDLYNTMWWDKSIFFALGTNLGVSCRSATPGLLDSNWQRRQPLYNNFRYTMNGGTPALCQ